MASSCCKVEQILSQLRTDDPPIAREVKLRVVDELRTQNATEALMALQSAVKDAEPEYRCSVAWVFLLYDFASALRCIRPLLLQDADDGVRGYVCEILGASRRNEAVPLLIDVLFNEPDGANRFEAAWGLGNIGDPAALPALKLAVQNDDGVDYEGRPVKKIAAEAIRRITQEKAAASVA